MLKAPSCLFKRLAHRSDGNPCIPHKTCHQGSLHSSQFQNTLWETHSTTQSHEYIELYSSLSQTPVCGPALLHGGMLAVPWHICLEYDCFFGGIRSIFESNKSCHTCHRPTSLRYNKNWRLRPRCVGLWFSRSSTHICIH